MTKIFHKYACSQISACIEVWQTCQAFNLNYWTPKVPPHFTFPSFNATNFVLLETEFFTTSCTIGQSRYYTSRLWTGEVRPANIHFNTHHLLTSALISATSWTKENSATCTHLFNFGLKIGTFFSSAITCCYNLF